MEIPKRLWIGMVILGTRARLVPHPWDFTPMMAIGLFAGSHAREASSRVLPTLLALVRGDAVLGFYPGFWYVYAAALIPVLLGSLIRDRRGASVIVAAAVASSLLFFLITNSMFWASGQMYPHTIGGLSACYLAGIPFYQNQLLGDGVHTVIHRLYQPAQQAA
jgi:hypothetical protein